MFSFSTFAFPIALGVAIVISIALCFGCHMRDRWFPEPPMHSLSMEERRPQLWDLFIEDPVGFKVDETRWKNVQPFSVTRCQRRERRAVTEGASGTNRFIRTRLQQIQQRTGPDEFIRIAIAIAMPSADGPPPPKSTSYSETTDDSSDGDHLTRTFCIGLHEALVAGLPSDF
ncbi:hypothetical protein B0H11DRAFT_1257783 [Mycena galericulata]|nr:hypothetical protein B0H11DRAFT_1257783 [Mycena galericulata]